MRKLMIASLMLVLLIDAGCSKQAPPASAPKAAPKHEHKPPQGGTAVELGNEEYHLELVLDPATGRLQAFVMDGELEKFVRISEQSIEIVAKVSGKEEPLILKAIANPATGETVGDTSLFETEADWLKSVKKFDATLKIIVINGNKYEHVAFDFPNGNDVVEKEKK